MWCPSLDGLGAGLSIRDAAVALEVQRCWAEQGGSLVAVVLITLGVFGC